MSPEEEKKIAHLGRKLKDVISIELTVTKNEHSGAFRNFCDKLTSLAPKIHAIIENQDEAAPPVIQIGNIRYQAIPTGKELEPFLSALAGSQNYSRKLPAAVQQQVLKIEIPALLKIYITSHCPFCPQVVTQLLALAAANEFIKLSIIDGMMFPEMAKSDNIHSAPTVLLDDLYRWTGSIQVQEVVDMILSRDPSMLSAASLRNMFEDGDAVGVAEMMLGTEKIFPAFPELLIHEKWPVRLGAMVAFETIAAQKSNLAARVIPFLLERFSQAEDTIKGDILYLLGICGDQRIIPKLATVLGGHYAAEVKEAAADALEEISQRLPA